jgi:hypothetical protein
MHPTTLFFTFFAAMAAAAPVAMPQLGVPDGGDRKTSAARAAEPQVWVSDGGDRAIAA